MTWGEHQGRRKCDMKRPSSLPRCSRLMSLNRNMASFFLFKACDPNACPAPYLLQGIAMRGTHRIMLPATTKSSCIYVLCQYSRRHFFERRDILDCKCLVLSQTLMHTRVTKQPRGGGGEGRRAKDMAASSPISNPQGRGVPVALPVSSRPLPLTIFFFFFFLRGTTAGLEP